MRVSRAARCAPAYWACAGIHVVGVVLNRRGLRSLTQTAMMPALAAWVRSRNGPPLLLAALLTSAVGDLLMDLGLLLPAIGVYSAAHACYVALFTRGCCRRRWQILAVYAVLAAGVVALLWPGLGELRGPVAAYALMLTATAVTSGWHGRAAGLGGALFVASDTLIGAQLAGHDFRGRHLLIKLTYTMGQYQLARGALGRQLNSVG